MRRTLLVLLAGCTFNPETIPFEGGDRDAVTTPRTDGAGSIPDGANLSDGVPPSIDGPIVYDATPATPDAFSVPCPITAPSGYGVALPGRTSCYRVDDDLEWWLDAQADCDGDGSGTHLVVIDDALEHEFIKRIKPTGSNIWLGLSDRVSEGNWLWVTDQAVTLDWQGSTPTLRTDENCAELDNGGLWNDHDCVDGFNPGYRRRYVCEYDGVDPDTNNY